MQRAVLDHGRVTLRRMKRRPPIEAETLSRAWKVLLLSMSTVTLAGDHVTRSSQDSALHVTPATTLLVAVMVR